jgi:hypothetical protein
MRKWLILFLALSANTASAAPAWTWTDANGQVHYSDRPVPGARQIELAGAQAFGGSATAAARPATSAPAAQQPGATAPYRAIDILTPAEQQTLSNTAGNVPVRVSFEPGLQPGHRFDLVLDGQRRNLNTANLQLTLTEVFRGTHTLQVIVIDSAGAEVMRSAPRNFVVQQVSVQNPNSPLARPPGRNPGN